MSNTFLTPIQRKRVRLYFEVNERCVFCGKGMWVAGFHQPGKKSLEATIEHIIPKSVGGKNGENLTCSCKGCNLTRGTMDFDLFKLIRQVEHYDRLASKVRKKGTKSINFCLYEHAIWIKRANNRALVNKRKRESQNEQISA